MVNATQFGARSDARSRMGRSLVIVTGGAGFIGSNIVSNLSEQGRYGVVVCDALGSTTDGKWRNLAKSRLADFIGPEELFSWLNRNRDQIAAVVHMGAISATTEPDTDLILRTNFGLSRDLWSWCSDTQKTLVYASSAATYGAGELGFDDEGDASTHQRLRPLNAYGWSKVLFDRWALEKAEMGYAPPRWAGLKFFNVYGPNEGHKGSMRSVVHQMWPKASAGEAVTLFRSHNPAYADGGQLRDFVYVSDCAAVVAWMLDSPELHGIYNLGTGKARSFLDLVHATFAAAGRKPQVTYIDTPTDIRDKYQYFTEAKMQRLQALGYKSPFFNLEQGIEDYIRRFLSQPDPYR